MLALLSFQIQNATEATARAIRGSGTHLEGRIAFVGRIRGRRGPTCWKTTAETHRSEQKNEISLYLFTFPVPFFAFGS